VPDEVAETLVAEPMVFCGTPCDEGTPTDPGDATPDAGSTLRYDAENDLFILNLSTKDSAWVPDYTYGLDVLIDGVKAGEAYFSLR
jgi:hypothetical protein